MKYDNFIILLIRLKCDSFSNWKVSSRYFVQRFYFSLLSLSITPLFVLTKIISFPSTILTFSLFLLEIGFCINMSMKTKSISSDIIKILLTNQYQVCYFQVFIRLVQNSIKMWNYNKFLNNIWSHRFTKNALKGISNYLFLIIWVKTITLPSFCK